MGKSKYVCGNCDCWEDGKCWNRDSDLYETMTSPEDSCLDCEPKEAEHDPG